MSCPNMRWTDCSNPSAPTCRGGYCAWCCRWYQDKSASKYICFPQETEHNAKFWNRCDNCSTPPQDKSEPRSPE